MTSSIPPVDIPKYSANSPVQHSDVAENVSQSVQIDSKGTKNPDGHASALFKWTQHRGRHSARLAEKEGELEAETMD